MFKFYGSFFDYNSEKEEEKWWSCEKRNTTQQKCGENITTFYVIISIRYYIHAIQFSAKEHPPQ